MNNLAFRPKKPSSANPEAMPAPTTTPSTVDPQPTNTEPDQAQNINPCLMTSKEVPNRAHRIAIRTLFRQWHDGHFFVWARKYIERHGRKRLYNDAFRNWKRMALFALRAYMQRTTGSERNDVVEALKVIDGTKYFVGGIRATLREDLILSRDDDSVLVDMLTRMSLTRAWKKEEIETLRALKCL
ncbi:hypothetical protein GRF29_1536g1199097 [Pseudopithomyces chartarum]|uniref:Uncharacterized protein n=1 Tax=Pseudopithomyces chartarum TaxID=1892770 RepID=A0AAN6LN25_9PLEO|nr:hypothetical protein GRF29_1536g1199097 [Pseudopithomyces chartarum]